MSSSSSESENECCRIIVVDVHPPPTLVRKKKVVSVLRNVTNKPRRTDQSDWDRIDVIGSDKVAKRYDPSATKKQLQPQIRSSQSGDFSTVNWTHPQPKTKHACKRPHREICPALPIIQEENAVLSSNENTNITAIAENVRERCERTQKENIVNVVDPPQNNQSSNNKKPKNVHPTRKSKRKKMETRQKKLTKKTNAKTNKCTPPTNVLRKSSVASIPVTKAPKTFKIPTLKTFSGQLDTDLLQNKLAQLRKKLEMLQQNSDYDTDEANKNERKFKNCITALETAIKANQSK